VARVHEVGELTEDSPPTWLSSGGSVVFSSCCSGGGGSGGVGVMATVGGGGGGDQTSDLFLVDPRSASLALDLSTRVPVGLPLGLIQILAVYLYVGLGGESSTGITSTGSSSSSAVAAPSLPSSAPSLGLSDENTICLGATE
jgi:hypothetical protein